MQNSIESGVEKLSIHPMSILKLQAHEGALGVRIPSQNRYIRHLCEKFRLVVRRMTVPFSWQTIHHHGKRAMFLIFSEDDGRKREDLNKFTAEQMDRVRAALFLPEGTMPKWYDADDGYEDFGELNSEDEEMPVAPDEFSARSDKKVDPEPSKKLSLAEFEEIDEDFNSEDDEDGFFTPFESGEEHDAEEVDMPSAGLDSTEN